MMVAQTLYSKAYTWWKTMDYIPLIMIINQSKTKSSIQYKKIQSLFMMFLTCMKYLLKNR